MFHDSIIDRRLRNYCASHPDRPRPIPLPVPRVREIVAYLEGRTDSSGHPVRPPVTQQLRAFIDSELALSKASFLYWCERYAFVQFRTGEGGINLVVPFESQLLLIARLATDELRMWQLRDAGHQSFDAMCYFIHKARQLGFTSLCQLLVLYRAIFYSDIKSLTACLDDQKTQDAHAKWSLAYSRLPWWMQQPIAATEKDRGKLLANGSYVALQDFAQKSQIGQGNTWDGGHLTEIASVPDGYCQQHLENGLFPAIPRSMRALWFLESTAQGFGNWWHKSTEQARRGEFGRWRYIFIPWYAEASTHTRSDIPDGWQPASETLEHYDKVERTSPEFMNGRTVHLTREQMYFWETERRALQIKGALAYFLTNYCSDPNESFQYMEHGAFDSEKIILLDGKIDRKPVPYELVTTAQQRNALRDAGRIITDRDGPRVYSVGDFDLVPVHTDERDASDPRGLILMFERPRLDVTYSLGVDTAEGIVGWQRQFRTSKNDEVRKDNSVVSGWYRDPKSGLARQCVELAGPIAPREFAPYVLALGRLFCGANPQEMGAPLIIEIYPAAGGAQVQAQLQYQFGYYNFYQWKVFNGIEIRETQRWGWVSNAPSMRELWVRGKDYIEATHFPIRPQSQALIQEMSSSRWDQVRQRGMAFEGFHDDRVMAMLMALWQLYDWASPQQAAPQPVAARNASDPQRVDFQRRDLAGMDEFNAEADAWWDRMAAGN